MYDLEVGAIMRGGPWDKRHESIRRVYRIDGISPTLTAGGGGGTETKVIIYDNEKESDNLTDLNKRYDADEQADFTQSEAEEWATEIALRLQEGNLDPIPTNKPKKFEHYDFTYASLFSGIGGFEQALNNFGGQCVFASEIDKFAAQAYETLYGHKPAGDITQIDAKDVPDHDLLVGGFPCQSFSVAGKRKGFEDTRGTLFFEIARIAKEKQPRVLLLENVKGLVNHDKGRTLDVMIGTLNEIGYIVDFDVLNSKYFGVPQNRERIFIVAIREDLIDSEPFSEETTTGQTIVPKGKRRIGEWANVFNFDWPEQGDVTTRLRDILESNVDEKYYLDEEKTAKLVAQLEAQEPPIEPSEINVLGNMGRTGHGNFNVFSDEGVGRTVAARDYKDPMRIAEPQMLGHVDLKGNDSIKRTYSTDGISPTLTTMGGGHREPKIAEEQSNISGMVIGGTQKNAYKGDGSISPTLTEAMGAGGGHIPLRVESPQKYRIRKLTPLECWRLQGFPDEAHEAVKQAGISDSQRYKQAGNAVTVNVIEAIAERLIPLIVDA